MTTKSQIINSAYSQMRISGITVDPSPEHLELALERLEDMAAEFEARNICLNFNFEDVPDPASLTNTPRVYNQMLKTNLAVRLIPDFNKVVPQTLMAQASQSLASSSGISAREILREVQYPRRMPRGSGNNRVNHYRRFQYPNTMPPISCSTNRLTIGEQNDYQESFETYLGDESIASYVITADSGLMIISDSNATPYINYRVKAQENTGDGVFQQVKITITTSTGRIETSFIDFEVTSDRTVDGQ